MEELLSTPYLKSEGGHQYREGIVDKGGNNVFYINLQDENDEDGKGDSIEGMSTSDVEEILGKVADFLVIKVDGDRYEWDGKNKIMQSYDEINTDSGKQTYYYDEVTFASCEDWILQKRYSNIDSFEKENEASDGKYLLFSPDNGITKVVIELSQND